MRARYPISRFQVSPKCFKTPAFACSQCVLSDIVSFASRMSQPVDSGLLPAVTEVNARRPLPGWSDPAVDQSCFPRGGARDWVSRSTHAQLPLPTSMTPQLSLRLQLLITAPQPQPLNQLAALLAAGQLPLLCELERWIRSRSSGPGNNLATAREFIIVGHAQQGLRPKQSAFTTFSPSSMVRVRALTSSTFPTVGRLLLHLRILTGANGAPSLGRLLLAPTTSLSSLDCSLRVVARVTGHRSFAQSSIHQFTCLIYQMGDNNKPGGFTCHDYDKVNCFFNHPIIVVEAENHRNLPAAPGSSSSHTGR
ncbi:hypothetical protein IWX90DRAFT_265116 [Phyllosticta citrichinensis]|uniref:Uncharacterized protein n=1 Tax=Phyllosticta citrichinensis TaxID=1130410 RepID=A0ABR1XMD7_9PEZI